jgi:hypothetical protein
MLHRSLAFVLFLGLSTEVAQAEPPAWQLTLTTSGGFTGKGVGNVRVGAEGVVVLEREGKKETKLPAEALKALAAAVTRAQPAEWKRTYGGGAKARDGIAYELIVRTTIEGKERTHRVGWDDNAKQADLPKDLAELIAGVKPLLR